MHMHHPLHGHQSLLYFAEPCSRSFWRIQLPQQAISGMLVFWSVSCGGSEMVCASNGGKINECLTEWSGILYVALLSNWSMPSRMQVLQRGAEGLNPGARS